MTQGHSGSADDSSQPGALDADALDALAAGLNSTRSMTVYVGWVGHYPAVVRDEASALAMLAGKPVDMRALVWRAVGFRPIRPGQRPPPLREDWVVRVRGGRLAAVDTQFGPDAAVMGCDWVTESSVDGGEVVGDGAVPDQWVEEARRWGGVALVSADLGLGPDLPDDMALRKVLADAAAAGRLLAGLARLDCRP